MKKSILFFILSAFITNAFAEEKLVVEKLLAPQGGKANLVVNFEFDENHDYCSYEFSVVLPEGITVSGKPVLSEANPDQSASIDNNKLVAFSLNNTLLVGNKGLLVSIPVTVDNSLEIGSVLSGKLTGISFGFSSKSGGNYFTDASFDIEVVEDITVLDESSTTPPVASEGSVKVKVIRTIKANEWSTICLPFAMTEAQVNAGFGEDVQVQLGDFTGYETEEDAEENIVGIKVKFDNVTEIEANHPYIIKVNKPVNQIIAEEVTIAPEDEPTVSFGTTTGKGKNAVYHPMDFNGTYVADFDFYNAARSTPLFLSSGNKFYYATESTQFMKAFRAYFDFDDVLASVDASRIVLSLNNETSGISQIENKAMKNENVFDLQGRRVSQPQKGLYIKGGKKVIMK